MTSGILGIVACPMLEDELIYGLMHDDEPKRIYVADTEYCGSLRRKMDSRHISYSMIHLEAFKAGNADLGEGGFRIVVIMNDLGLHEQPKDLKEFIEQQVESIQSRVDAIGLYYGLCGNYGWDVPAWCQKMGYKPTAVFRDPQGRICDDCIGVCVGGGPRYLELEKKHVGEFYVTPAVASNWKDFIGHMDIMKGLNTMSQETLQQMGVSNPDDYMRWMFNLCGYTTMLQIDTGLMDRADFDACAQDVSEKTGLRIKQAEPEWPTLQPAQDLYAQCKQMLAQ